MGIGAGQPTPTGSSVLYDQGMLTEESLESARPKSSRLGMPNDALLSCTLHLENPCLPPFPGLEHAYHQQLPTWTSSPDSHETCLCHRRLNQGGKEGWGSRRWTYHQPAFLLLGTRFLVQSFLRFCYDCHGSRTETCSFIKFIHFIHQ